MAFKNFGCKYYAYTKNIGVTAYRICKVDKISVENNRSTFLIYSKHQEHKFLNFEIF
jgi:hypothetical protein